MNGAGQEGHDEKILKESTIEVGEYHNMLPYVYVGNKMQIGKGNMIQIIYNIMIAIHHFYLYVLNFLVYCPYCYTCVILHYPLIVHQSHNTHIYIYYIYIPRTQLTSIFEGQPSKTRPFPIKTRVIWVYIYIYGSVSRVATPPPWYGPPPLPPYLIHFAHATVAKRTFPYFCMHAAVAKRTFSFCWMNPPAGFGGSIARNCGEMQILSSRNCSAQCTGHFNAQQMESIIYIYISMYIHIHKHQ